MSQVDLHRDLSVYGHRVLHSMGHVAVLPSNNKQRSGSQTTGWIYDIHGGSGCLGRTVQLLPKVLTCTL
jgi:hypothetical protein